MRRRKAEATPEAALPRVDAPRPDDLTVRPGGGRIGEILADHGLVPREAVQLALAEAQRGGPPKLLGQRLLDRGLVNERALAWAVARQQLLDYIDLREINPEPAAIGSVSESVARQMTVVPLALQGDTLIVAMAFPTAGTVAALAEMVEHPLSIKVAAPSDIMRVINNNYKALAGVGYQIRAFQAQQHANSGARPIGAARPEPVAGADDAPVVQVVQLIITQALRDRASDIHIEPQKERVRVRFRIDGALHDVIELPAAMGPVVVSRIKILANMNIVERRRAQDGQISMEVERRSVDIRVSTTAVVEGEKVVMRLLDKSRPLFRLGQLGMPEHMVNRYSALLRSPYGMVICAGPTGSGKTTTLYGSLAEINSPERNVMTIEDPIEYRIPSINQIQINEQAGITFAGGLKSILRQDPDVILVGEIRDEETARIAVQSALTGHFVLSSLHATDTAAALHRLLEMDIEAFLVASSVTAVVSQRLVRRICDHCRGTYQPGNEELALLSAIGGRPPQAGFVRGHGCNFCAQTGFLERIGVYEMMLMTEAIRELVLRRAPHDEIRSTARREGMRMLKEEAARLVETGVTTLGEVLRSVYVAGR
jgi:type IV pilus assembly protein PilB